ncbi:MAG: hypothetical protein QNJ54_25830 [Prochloraceae cyanobacterium]|nr:hypothetical protein [Prochloraceae cyanobacterium]
MNYELERLEIRLGFIQQRISNIRSSGKIAPPRTWIQKYVVPKKNGKKYYYYRLMEAGDKRSPSGAIQGQLKLYLGSKKNPKYHSYKQAIARRNELQLLQQRYKKLMALYRKALSQAVSVGFEEKLVEILPSADLNFRDLANVLEETQHSIEQLWYCLKAIGKQIGIVVTPEYQSTG